MITTHNRRPTTGEKASRGSRRRPQKQSDGTDEQDAVQVLYSSCRRDGGHGARRRDSLRQRQEVRNQS